MLTDLRHAIRRWRQRPAFAAIAVLILALGIGATTSVFSVIDGVLLRPLPWPEAERLVAIYDVQPERASNPAFADTWNRGRITWSAWQALRSSRAFEDVGVWMTSRQALGEDRSQVVETVHASSAFLRLLGAQIVLGRTLGPEDDTMPSDAILISHRMWQGQFGGSADIVGKTTVLAYLADSGAGGAIKRIAGVLAPSFEHPGTTGDVFLPMGLNSYIGRFPNRMLSAVGRLAPGVSIESALGVADPIIRGSDPPAKRTGRLVRLADERIGGAAPPLWLLLGGAGLLLIVACSNVAGLLLGEARGRRHEIAVRTALGGSRGRLLRQLTIEHLLLAVAAGFAGLVLARWITPGLVALAPPSLPGLDAVTINARASALALVLGLSTALFFGLAPAVSLFSTRASEALAEGARKHSRRGAAGQRLIVAAELALALVLVVCASLFGETMMRLSARGLGFDPANIAVISTTVTAMPGKPLPGTYKQSFENWGEPERPAPVRAGTPARRVSRDESIVRYEREMLASQAHTAGALERLKALPGVMSVAGAGTAPFTGGWVTMRVKAAGRPAEEEQVVQRQVITEGYFETMGIPILRGRAFGRSDRPPASAAIISQELERRLFGGNALGKRLMQGTISFEVVGIAANARQRAFTDEELAAVYVLDRRYGQAGNLLVRTTGDARSTLLLMADALRQYDPRMVVTSMTTMEQLVAKSVAEQRFRATLASVFGGAALLLAAIGVYGLAARRVTERRHEIGVRVALGAEPRDVRRLVLREAWVMVALGFAGGIPAAYAASQATQSLLFGVSSTAPHVFIMAAVFLAAAAIVATLVPARRASHIDPMLALRE